VATKYPTLTAAFLAKLNYRASWSTPRHPGNRAGHRLRHLICDIVSSGQTLRDNHLRALEDGTLLRSERLDRQYARLEKHPRALSVARILLEYFEAHCAPARNCRSSSHPRASPEAIAGRIFNECNIHACRDRPSRT